MAYVAIEVESAEVMEKMRQLRTDHPERDKQIRTIVAHVLKKARTATSKDAKQLLTNDPRQAYRAVRFSNYKRAIGGQINIISQRKASRTRVTVRKEGKLKPHQWGGNRRERTERTEQIDSYYGKDRGFILRFQNDGTTERETRYGARGRLSARNWFGASSTRHIQEACEELSQLLDEATERLWNK